MKTITFLLVERWLSEFRRSLITMKLVILLLITGLLQVAVASHPQQVTLKVESATIQDVLFRMSQQTGYDFIYDASHLDNNRRVSLDITDQSVRTALEACFKGVPVSFVFNTDKTVIIKPKPATSRAPVAVAIQQKVVTGRVTDTTGIALPGVSVSLKNKPSYGTTTDLNGRYSLEVTPQDILTFSMVGFETIYVTVGNKTSVNAVLKESDSQLDDVVVVGFGTQKRTDMIGSIVSVKPEALKVPSSNLTTALAGKVAGMIAFQRSGEPGMDNADFFIRGVTTFGYKVDPLILIDNVEVTTTDLARLQVDDIKEFSIMKDATATAVYGARGANGVILITTKEGKEGPAKISFRAENSLSTPTQNVELADPVTYMKLHNEAVLTRNALNPLPYTYQQINNTVEGADPYLYPQNDWRSLLMKDYTMNQRFNLNVSGGGKIARYFISGAYNKDNGMLKVDKKNNFNNNIDLKSYSLRGNVNIDLTSSTELLMRLNGTFDDYSGPIDGGTKVYRDIMRTNPVRFAPYYPGDGQYRYVQHIMFGNYEGGKYLNPYADMVKGYKDSSRSMMLAQLELRQKLSFITEGLTFRTLMNTTRNSYFDISRSYNPFYYQIFPGSDPFAERSLLVLNEDEGTEYLSYVPGNKTVNSIFYWESALNYSRTFADKHTFGGLLVYIMRNRLEGNSGTIQESLAFRNLGLSGRMTYSYDNRYFAEFNFGYNGSERFDKNHRFGFFPSAGLAWSISNEKFFEPLKKTVTNLRLRGTYGLVGNDAIGRPADRFFYLSDVNMNSVDRGAVFGLDRSYNRTGVFINRYSNSDITWETAYKSNVALEIGLFNKWKIVTDAFYEYRKNILMPRSDIPSTMGLSAQILANLGEASGRGIDVALEFTESLRNGAWLQGMANFTYATSKYEVYEEPMYNEPWMFRKGNPISLNRGFIAERLFLDDEEVRNSPTQSFGEVRGGDIKYMDINNDGKITDLDRVPLGFPTTPEINYGFGLSAGIKSFDASVFFQGLARESFWIDPYATSPFAAYRYTNSGVLENFPTGTILQNQLLKAYADSHWSEDNRNIYALWPRLSETANTNNSQVSTWFMRNGAFLRLKQVEVGYTAPQKTMSKLHIAKLRVYVNATNLLTWSKFKLWDVEMAGNGLGYPIQKVFNLGAQVSF